jgi:hypothetical protein
MMRIIKDQSAGLVIDIQEKLFPLISDNETLVNNSGILIKGLQALNIPLLVTEQYTKGLGPTIQPLKELLPGEKVIEKLAFSCCGIHIPVIRPEQEIYHNHRD